MIKTINLQIQKAQCALNIRNVKKIKPRHIIIKLLKASEKEKNLKSTQRKRHIMQSRTKIMMTGDFSLEQSSQSKRQWTIILKY